MKLAALAALVAVTGFAVVPAHAAKGPIKITRVQVSGKEFFYALSRKTVAPGPAIVQFANFGEDPHDLRLQRRGARHIAGLREVAPGERAQLTLRLPPGRYSLWCSIGDHRKRGMSATLVVTR